MQNPLDRREADPPQMEAAAPFGQKGNGGKTEKIDVCDTKACASLTQDLPTDRLDRFGALLAISLKLMRREGVLPSEVMESLEQIARAMLGPVERAFIAATLLASCERDDREAICDAGRGVTPFWTRDEIDAEAKRQRRKRGRA